MKKLRIGIVGLGRVASKTHIPVLRTVEGLRIVSGAEKNPERAKRVRELFGLESVYADYEEMYEKEGLDGVYICLPHHLHRDAALSALKRGIHVLCEKPMGLSVAEAAELDAAARETGLVLMPGYKMRYAASYSLAKKAIEDGRLGRIIHVQGTFVTPGPYIGWDPKSDWHLDGRWHGAIYDSGCHLVDLVLHLVPGEVGKVRAFATRGFIGYDAPTNIACAFEMEGGIVGDLAIAWRGANDVHSISVHGTAGSVHVTREHLSWIDPGTDPADRIIARLGEARAECATLMRKVRDKITGKGFYAEDWIQARAFADAIRGVRPPPIDGSDAIRIHAFLERIVESV